MLLLILGTHIHYFSMISVIIFVRNIAEDEFTSIILKSSVKLEEGDTLKNVKSEKSAFFLNFDKSLKGTEHK